MSVIDKNAKPLNTDTLIQMTPTKQSTGSSINSIQNILYSTINLDKEQALRKIDLIENLINLNQVEKQIISQVKTQLDIGQEVNADYYREKFSYYFELSPKREIPLAQLDFAMLDVQAKQERDRLTQELLDLAGDVENIDSLTLRARILELQERSILTQTQDTEIVNGIQRKESASAEMRKKGGEFTLSLPEVEQAAGRAARGHIVSILAYTGSYKSTYALQMAYDNALEGHNVLYLSLESSEDEMFHRVVLNHIARTATKRSELIDQTDFRDGNLLESQYEHYDNKHNELVDKLDNHMILLDTLKFKFDTFTEMTNTLRNADKTFKETTGKGLDILVVDQLSLLKYTKASGRKATYDGAVMNDWMIYFAGQAQNFLLENERKILFVNIAQVRREAYQEASKKKNKGRYDASAASDSHEIERTSDTMITIYKDLDQKNTTLFNIPKARHGAMLDEPVQVETYGEYFHIGSMTNLEGETITADSFKQTDFDLANLLKTN